MITVFNEDKMIPAQIEAVKQDMAQRVMGGPIENYSINLGNGCLFVHYKGSYNPRFSYSVNLHYMFDKNNNILAVCHS